MTTKRMKLEWGDTVAYKYMYMYDSGWLPW